MVMYYFEVGGRTTLHRKVVSHDSETCPSCEASPPFRTGLREARRSKRKPIGRLLGVKAYTIVSQNIIIIKEENHLVILLIIVAKARYE